VNTPQRAKWVGGAENGPAPPCDESFSTFLLDSINSVRWDPSDERHARVDTSFEHTHETTHTIQSTVVDREKERSIRGEVEIEFPTNVRRERIEKGKEDARFLELLKTLGKKIYPLHFTKFNKTFYVPWPLAEKHAALQPRFILRDKNAIAWNFTAFIILV